MKGRDSVSRKAAHAIAAQSNSWHQPKATRGSRVRRAKAAPRLLPTPRLKRKAARMSENAYTVAPTASASKRVHKTSAASAVKPESAIAT